MRRERVLRAGAQRAPSPAPIPPPRQTPLAPPDPFPLRYPYDPRANPNGGPDAPGSGSIVASFRLISASKRPVSARVGIIRPPERRSK